MSRKYTTFSLFYFCLDKSEKQSIMKICQNPVILAVNMVLLWWKNIFHHFFILCKKYRIYKF